MSAEARRLIFVLGLVALVFTVLLITKRLSADWKVWMAALASLSVYSYLFRETRLFRIAEHLMLGLGAGYGVAAMTTDLLGPKWYDRLVAAFTSGHPFAAWHLMLAFVVGLFWYSVYFPRIAWLGRVVAGLTIGAGAGLAFRSMFTQNVPQVVDSFKPLVVRADTAQQSVFLSFSNIVFVVALLTVLSYFFFSIEYRSRTLTGSAKVGRLFLMIGFGVYFGNTVMTRLAVFIDRVWYLFTNWLGLGKPFGT